MLKPSRMKWAGNVAFIGERRNAYWILVGKREGKRALGIPRRMSDDNNYTELEK
jgi:hypothetical protein